MTQETDRLLNQTEHTSLFNPYALHEIRLRGLIATGRIDVALQLVEQGSPLPTTTVAPQWRVIEVCQGGRRMENVHEEGDRDDVKRRTLLGSTAIGVSAAAEPWGRLAFALSKGSRIDTPAAVALINRAADLHVQELNVSARRLQGTVESHLDAITAALPHAGCGSRPCCPAARTTSQRPAPTGSSGSAKARASRSSPTVLTWEPARG